ncbi:methyltransferase family protein [Murinocardiopsis flavida]|uniref:Methyltransferase family protein n=1 Tax=Murinocardiopsis flavida TaxID=645275 RepID=A0A2P8DUJ7_9ACTN|nr:methyltransferase [Murinocardiopsis flavida]PSL00862.1 methyltransferase family protein [Murinocardiopsis flavida]
MTAMEEIHSADYQRMMSYSQGMWISQVVRTVADLSVPEHLREGPRTAGEIAEAASADPHAVFRLMRACVALELVSYDAETDRFAATRLLGALRRSADGTLANWARVQAAPGHWQSWGAATEAVRAGSSRTAEVLGSPLFDYFSGNGAEGALFSAAMTDLTAAIGTEAAAVIDTAGVGVAVDVGGANGAFVHELMRRDPGVAGVVLDLPATVAGAQEEAERGGLQDRVTVTGGDFFESVPSADLYLLKFILHDWDDESGVRILRNCRSAMNPGGRICVVEMVVGETGAPGLDAALMDMNMLMVTQGRERDHAEFDTLLERAGLRRVKDTPIPSPTYPYSVIEAVARD